MLSLNKYYYYYEMLSQVTSAKLLGYTPAVLMTEDFREGGGVNLKFVI